MERTSSEQIVFDIPIQAKSLRKYELFLLSHHLKTALKAGFTLPLISPLLFDEKLLN